MTIEENKAVVRRFVDEVWNRTNLDAADELFAADFSRHGEVLGPAGVKALLGRLGAASPDLHWTIEDLLADGDMVVLRHSSSRTSSGAPLEHPVFGRVTPPAGLVSTMHGVNIFRLVDGKVAEVWEYANVADLAWFGREAGLLPRPGQSPT